MAKKNKKGIIIGVVAACAAIGALTPDKEAESTELSVPAYQAEYDINTEIPVEVSSPDEAAAEAEEERLAQEAEEQKAAEEQAAREEEEQKLAEEQAAREAEKQKLAEEQAAREAEEQKAAEEKAAKEAENQKAVEKQKLLSAQSEKNTLPDTSVSDVVEQSEPVQPEETAVIEEPSAPEESIPTPVSEMVWLSATGEKYHSINNCGRMNPNKARQVSLEDAISGGYGKCSKCW